MHRIIPSLAVAATAALALTGPTVNGMSTVSAATSASVLSNGNATGQHGFMDLAILPAGLIVATKDWVWTDDVGETVGTIVQPPYSLPTPIVLENYHTPTTRRIKDYHAYGIWYPATTGATSSHAANATADGSHASSSGAAMGAAASYAQRGVDFSIHVIWHGAEDNERTMAVPIYAPELAIDSPDVWDDEGEPNQNVVVEYTFFPNLNAEFWTDGTVEVTVHGETYPAMAANDFILFMEDLGFTDLGWITMEASEDAVPDGGE